MLAQLESVVKLVAWLFRRRWHSLPLLIMLWITITGDNLDHPPCTSRGLLPHCRSDPRNGGRHYCHIIGKHHYQHHHHHQKHHNWQPEPKKGRYFHSDQSSRMLLVSLQNSATTSSPSCSALPSTAASFSQSSLHSSHVPFPSGHTWSSSYYSLSSYFLHCHFLPSVLIFSPYCPYSHRPQVHCQHGQRNSDGLWNGFKLGDSSSHNQCTGGEEQSGQQDFQVDDDDLDNGDGDGDGDILSVAKNTAVSTVSLCLCHCRLSNSQLQFFADMKEIIFTFYLF